MNLERGSENRLSLKAKNPFFLQIFKNPIFLRKHELLRKIAIFIEIVKIRGFSCFLIKINIIWIKNHENHLFLMSFIEKTSKNKVFDRGKKKLQPFLLARFEKETPPPKETRTKKKQKKTQKTQTRQKRKKKTKILIFLNFF